MRKIFKVLILLAAAAAFAAFTGLAASAEETGAALSGQCGDNVFWELTEDGTLTISGEGDMWDYEWYSKVPWYSYNIKIQNLSIGYGVTSIGNYAFYCCGIGNLTIPESVNYIGDYAFYGCSKLTGDIIISASVNYIGYNAFVSTSGDISAIEVSENNNNYSSYDGVLYSKDYKTLIYCPKGKKYFPTVHPNTQVISDYAFYCNYNFTGDLYIPDGIKSIGDYAFFNCFSLDGCLILPNCLTNIGDRAFEACAGLNGSLDLPNNVTYIGKGAFSSCQFRGDLIIPDSVTYIGEYAFYGCKYFDGSLTLSNNISSIEDYTFYSCRFTGSLSIPDGVTSIGKNAFDHCVSFTGDLTIPDGVTTIGEYAFYYAIGFEGCLKLPDSVDYIGEHAFFCCRFTGELILPKNLKTIGRYAFSACSGFTGDLVIPDGVTSIGDEAFRNCSGFNGTLTLSKKLTYIGQYAFSSCNGFTGSLTIPNSVTTIEVCAFDRCDGFTGKLIISKNLGYLGPYSFSCPGITEAYFYGNAPKYLYQYFASRLITVYYPEGKSGWTTPTWNGYNTQEFTVVDEEAAYSSYIDTINNKVEITLTVSGDIPLGTGSVDICDYMNDSVLLSIDINSSEQENDISVERLYSENNDTTELFIQFRNINGLYEWYPVFSGDIFDNMEVNYIYPEKTEEIKRKGYLDVLGFANEIELFKNKSSVDRYIFNEIDKQYLQLQMTPREYKNVTKYSDEKWNGACVGFASIAMLNAAGKLSPDALCRGKERLEDITKSDLDKSLVSKINTFFALQKTNVFSNAKLWYKLKLPSGKISDIKKYAESAYITHRPYLICLSYADEDHKTHEHALLGYDIENGRYYEEGNEYDLRIAVYDCTNAPGIEAWFYINTENNKWYYRNTLGAYNKIILVTDDLNIVDPVGFAGYLGKDNAETVILNGSYLTVYNKYSELMAFDIAVNDSVYRIYPGYDNPDAGLYTLPVFKDAVDENGDLSRSDEYMLVLPDGASEIVMTPMEGESLDFAYMSNDFLISAEADSMRSVHITADGEVTAEGITGECRLSVTVDDASESLPWNTVEVRAYGTDSLALSRKDDRVTVGGDLTNITVKAENREEIKELTFGTEKTSAEIISERRTEHEISVKIDRDGDGEYETLIGNSGILFGDADGDGVPCTPHDAMILARWLAGWEGYEIDENAADADGDETVTIRDALILARMIAEWEGYEALPYAP